jgi:hypothetical protein
MIGLALKNIRLNRLFINLKSPSPPGGGEVR